MGFARSARGVQGVTTAKRGGLLLVTFEHGDGAQPVTGMLHEVPSRVPRRWLAGRRGHLRRASETGWAEVGPRHDDAANVMDLDIWATVS